LDTNSGLIFSHNKARYKQKLIKLSKKIGNIITITGVGINNIYTIKKLLCRSDDILIIYLVFLHYITIGIYIGLAYARVFTY